MNVNDRTNWCRSRSSGSKKHGDGEWDARRWRRRINAHQWSAPTMRCSLLVITAPRETGKRLSSSNYSTLAWHATLEMLPLSFPL